MKVRKPRISQLMFIWLATRTDAVDYDEYDSCVLSAHTREEAIKLAQTLFPDRATIRTEIIGTTVEESKILHKSFCAG